MRRHQRSPTARGRRRASERLEGWVRQRRARIRGRNPWRLGIEVARAAGRHRVTGTAAEMSFYAVLGLVPLTVAFGAALGYVERFVGPDGIAEGQRTAIMVLTTLIGPELTADAVAPFVRTQLVQERGGLALGSLLIAAWLGSRMFTPAQHALDLAHEIDEPRSVGHQRLVGLGLAVGSLLASVLTLVIMIVGPLLGTGQSVADQLGLGTTYRLVWLVGRWPLLLLILVGFLVGLYRFAPSRRPPWRACVPGAVLALGAWIAVALGFRLYLAVGGRPGTGVGAEEEVIVLVGRVVAAVVATMLWAFLSSTAILVGGEVNAVLARVTVPDDDA
jgi:membrane protein